MELTKDELEILLDALYYRKRNTTNSLLLEKLNPLTIKVRDHFIIILETDKQQNHGN